MRLSVSMPCFGRPQRTIRAINCIANQNINGWEAFVIGDGCPVMQDFIDSNYFKDIIEMCSYNGNDLIINNNPVNQGGHGFAITNRNIEEAEGKYFIFFANDDIILPNHFENYLSQIEGTDLDFVYFNSQVKPTNSLRVSRLEYGMIGHSELIVRTEFLRQMPTHNEHYGHDWALIQSMITESFGNHKKAENCPATYHVMSLSDNREQGID
jgi:glycosyltransferase involved in cell wall biosynthesis